MSFRAILVVLACTPVFAAGAELQSVQVKGVKLNVPADWKQQPTRSNMRLAQFAVPAVNGGQAGEFVVFYFGGGATGGIKANVQRWVGQFAADDRKVEVLEGKWRAGRYVLVDAVGTWNKPDGPPFARKTIPVKDSRVINVILIREGGAEDEYFFLKLSGSKALVTKQADALRAAIGAQADSEVPSEVE